MIRVKICGITNLEDAKLAVGAGCDALGFVFYRKSPRYIAPQKAREIIRQLPKGVIKVGVFVNAEEKTVKGIAKTCGLDILQFHGDESLKFCGRFKGYKIIKAFRINPVRNTNLSNLKNKISNGVKDKLDLKNVTKYKTFAYLFDTFVRAKAGGTGKVFDWKIIRRIIDKIKRPIFLSGGLTKDNVREAIKTIRPTWIDVSSSVETRPGKKDYKKVKEFIGIVRKSRPGLETHCN